MEVKKKQIKEIGKYREWGSVILYRVVKEGVTHESTCREVEICRK